MPFLYNETKYIYTHCVFRRISKNPSTTCIVIHSYTNSPISPSVHISLEQKEEEREKDEANGEGTSEEVVDFSEAVLEAKLWFGGRQCGCVRAMLIILVNSKTF